MEVENEYFIIEKHWPQKKGKDGRRRHFYKIDEIEKAFVLASEYSKAKNVDFLVCKVMREFSKPKGNSS